ncbi:MAG: PEP-CTERM sorting domain-containing protein [Tepidisphaeraceae bacterium]
MTRKPSNKRVLLSLLTAGACAALAGEAQATLILYDDFNYTVGDRLGGSGTSPVGQVAPNGQTWITRSPALAGSYNPVNDTQITAGNLSYAGLATSSGNSIRYGSSVASGATNLYTDAIALPSAVTSGSLYYSMIVRFNGAVAPGGVRHNYASLSTESANVGTDAGLGLGTSSGTSNIPMPAGAWMRDSGTTDFHLGSGKANSDGMGPSASAPSWQSIAAGHPFPNQQGNTGGTGQDKATIAADGPFFVVLKYTYNGASAADDTVSMWINPIASSLGDNAGELVAGGAAGSYYSATNAFVTAALDASTIQSFVLLGRGQASAANVNKSIDTSLDELRIGTTWADVTPAVPEPASMAALSLLGAGMTMRRRKR